MGNLQSLPGLPLLRTIFHCLHGQQPPYLCPIFCKAECHWSLLDWTTGRFQIKYCPGTVYRDADTLSRIPFDAYMLKCTEETSPDTIQAIITSVQAQSQGKSSWFISVSVDPGLHGIDDTMLKSRTATDVKQMDLKQAQACDTSIGKVIQYLKSGNCPQVKDLPGEHPDTKQLLHEW